MGANPEADDDGRFPFHLAASLGKESALRYLLAKFEGRRTFDINVTDKDGNTPLHEAAMRCREDKRAVSMVELLISKGIAEFEVIT